MKILALGCGDMGRMAIAILLESPKVSSITVADINIRLVETFIELAGSNKMEPFQIDITDQKKLIELMKSHDIIINTIGPFYKFMKPILKAAISARKPLLDIADDWKPTLEALEMDQQAKDADIPIIIGIGASPGITNLMAVLACNELDEVDKLITAWGEWLRRKEGKKPQFYVKPKKIKKKLGKQPKKPSAAIVHFIYESLGKIPTFLNGEMVEIESLTEHEPLKFPGFKEIYVCHIGHPEPVTLPRTIKAKTINNLCYVGETLTVYLRAYIQKIVNNEITIDEVAIIGEKLMRKIKIRAMTGRSPLKEYWGGPPDLCVIATGIKDGQKKKIAIALGRMPYDQIAGLTGVPLAIATLMYIDGLINKKGVLTPEESIDPKEFFKRLAVYCGKDLSGDDILIKKVTNL
jgi:saccharopine dehydrogenase-like NADP-dependent oxidoreductase